MFQPGRILQMGGASSAALVIDINGAQPVVTSTQSMSTQRQWVSATVLPDGKVLGTGGSDVENQLTGVNNVAEIWNPATGHLAQGASGGERAPVSLGGAAACPMPRCWSRAAARRARWSTSTPRSITRPIYSTRPARAPRARRSCRRRIP